jgi:poly(A) polymerase/tRNA nucleotidyltransferase (CCA-adding enzyme)
MRSSIPNTLFSLAFSLPTPLYVVGGSVRDHLANLHCDIPDWDICAPISAQDFAEIATQCGFTIQAVYKNTGIVKLADIDGVDYEYTCFRSDKYVRGTHVPVEIHFTDDIALDARRRDFTANAIYYDIQAENYVDPLGGIADAKENRLRTVTDAKKVFGEDGLRLMRLARQAAQLNFYPDEECLQGAKMNAALIKDISPERIFTELLAILYADEKYGHKNGPYLGLTLLQKTGVLHHILPELALGENMAQRADFHKYDVLEHSLRAACYAGKGIRLAALLHDVGKPFCKLRDGNSYAHADEGAQIAVEILTRLKAPKKTIEQVRELTLWHMYDFDCKTKEPKLRRFFIEHYEILEELLLIKQADYSACTDDFEIAPTCRKWQSLLDAMRKENAPFTLKELAVNGNDLKALGIPAPKLAYVLHELLLHAAVNPKDNEKPRLLRLARALYL